MLPFVILMTPRKINHTVLYNPPHTKYEEGRKSIHIVLILDHNSQVKPLSKSFELSDLEKQTDLSYFKTLMVKHKT